MLEEIFFNQLNDLSNDEEKEVFECYFNLKKKGLDPINELDKFHSDNIFNGSKQIKNYEYKKSIIDLKYNKIKSYFLKLSKQNNTINYNVNNVNSFYNQYNNLNERSNNQRSPNTNIYPNNYRKKYNNNFNY